MIDPIPDPGSCGIVLEDIAGYTCQLAASEKCSDCGTDLCTLHADGCDVCQQVFCDGCLYFHMKRPHAKPVERIVPASSAERSA